MVLSLRVSLGEMELRVGSGIKPTRVSGRDGIKGR